MTLRQLLCRLRVLFGLAFAVGCGESSIYVAVPDDIDQVALIWMTESKLSRASYHSSTALMDASAGPIETTTERPFLIIGYGDDQLAEIEMAALKQHLVQVQYEVGERESLPPPRWHVAIETNGETATDVEIPPLTSEALPLYPTWSKLDTSQAPTARYWYSLSFDAERQRTVLFGGRFETGERLGDTWELGLDWAPVSTSSAPSPRSQSAMAYHPEMKKTVLFSGFSEAGAMQDTWVYDGTWSQLDLDPAPSSRSGHRMVYDQAHNRIVLFGGAKLDVERNDTWVFDGTSWRQLHPISSPPARKDFGMAYFPGRQTVVVVGGASDGETVLRDDAWELDHEEWRPVPALRLPNPRRSFALAHDPSLEVLVLQGGYAGQNTLYEDTLVSDGDPWRVMGSNLPRRRHNAVYSPILSGIIAFGGTIRIAQSDTLIFR